MKIPNCGHFIGLSNRDQLPYPKNAHIDSRAAHWAIGGHTIGQCLANRPLLIDLFSIISDYY